ncbi:MAG TPA: molybdopterin molybdenumtransferase MoeA, partial [Thermopetrobacter sp.]|nr:molybdopterin molybdenumtransferase MoeA [Thermopetrobacter sp.]
AAKGRFIRQRGMDYRAGETLLEAGTKLGARQINLAASLNAPVLRVRRRPKVAILACGDELVLPGETPRDDQIIASNNFGLAAFVEQHGGEPVDLGLQPDDVNAIAAAIEKGRDADVLVTIGGASVGDYDFIGEAFERLRITRDFWKVAQRPGKPLMFARRGHQRILGLPGNPVSALVCAFLYLRPLMAKLLGTDMTPRTIRARLAADLPENDLRQDYLRVRLQEDEETGETLALPYSRQDSAMLRALAEADALLVRPAHAPALSAGAPVSVILIDF